MSFEQHGTLPYLEGYRISPQAYENIIVELENQIGVDLTQKQLLHPMYTSFGYLPIAVELGHFPTLVRNQRAWDFESYDFIPPIYEDTNVGGILTNPTSGKMYYHISAEDENPLGLFESRPISLSHLMAEMSVPFSGFIQSCLTEIDNLGYRDESYNNYFANAIVSFRRHAGSYFQGYPGFNSFETPEFSMIFQDSIKSLVVENLELLGLIHSLITACIKDSPNQDITYGDMLSEQVFPQLVDVLTKGPNGFVGPIVLEIIMQLSEPTPSIGIEDFFTLRKDAETGDIIFNSTPKYKSMLAQAGLIHRVNREMFAKAVQKMIVVGGARHYLLPLDKKIMHLFGRQSSCAAHTNPDNREKYFTNGFNQLFREIRDHYTSK